MAEKNSLWKNIRKKAEENRRTGATPKKPTTEMLRQERKIKAKKADGGPVGDDELYNMRRAVELGYTPDETGHWPSVDSETGMFLKSKEHPTAWMEYLYGHTLNPELNRTTNVVVNPEGYFGDNQLQYIPKEQKAAGGYYPTQGPGKALFKGYARGGKDEEELPTYRYANKEGVIGGPRVTDKGTWLPTTPDGTLVVNMPEFEVISTGLNSQPNPYSPTSLNDFLNSDANPVNWFLPTSEQQRQPIDPKTGMPFPQSGLATPVYPETELIGIKKGKDAIDAFKNVDYKDLKLPANTKNYKKDLKKIMPETSGQPPASKEVIKSFTDDIQKARDFIVKEGVKEIKDFTSEEGLRRARLAFKKTSPDLTDTEIDDLLQNQIFEIKNAVKHNLPEYMLDNPGKWAGNSEEQVANLNQYFPEDNAFAWHNPEFYEETTGLPGRSYFGPRPNPSDAFWPSNPEIEGMYPTRDTETLSDLLGQGKREFLNRSFTVPTMTIGKNYVGDIPTMAHELGHIYQRTGLHPVDIELQQLLSQSNPTQKKWNNLFKNSKEYNNSFNYFYSPSNAARRYPSEGYAFARETRQAMIDKGILKSKFEEITPAKILQYRLSQPFSMEGGQRLTTITPPWKWKELSGIMNDMNSTVPIAIGGTGAAAAATQQSQQQATGGYTMKNNNKSMKNNNQSWKEYLKYAQGGRTNPYNQYQDDQYLQYEVGGKVWKNIAAGLYGAGEGILDTVTMGATDELTDKGFEALSKAGNKNIDLNDPDDVKFLKSQQKLKGYGNAAGAIGTAVVTGNVQGAIKQGTKGLNTAFQATDGMSDDFKKWSQGITGVAGVASGFAGGMNSDSFNAASKAGTGVAGFGQKVGKYSPLINQASGMMGGNNQPLWQQGQAQQDLLNSPDYIAAQKEKNEAYTNQGLMYGQGGNMSNNSLNLRNTMRYKRFANGGAFSQNGITILPKSGALHHESADGGIPFSNNALAEGGEIIMDTPNGNKFVVSDTVDGTHSQPDFTFSKGGKYKELNRTLADGMRQDLKKYTMGGLATNPKFKDEERRPYGDSYSIPAKDQIKEFWQQKTEYAKKRNQQEQAIAQAEEQKRMAEEQYIAAYGGKINPKKYPGLNMTKKAKGGYVHNQMTQPMYAVGGPVYGDPASPYTYAMGGPDKPWTAPIPIGSNVQQGSNSTLSAGYGNKDATNSEYGSRIINEYGNGLPNDTSYIYQSNKMGANPSTEDYFYNTGQNTQDRKPVVNYNTGSAAPLSHSVYQDRIKKLAGYARGGQVDYTTDMYSLYAGGGPMPSNLPQAFDGPSAQNSNGMYAYPDGGMMPPEQQMMQEQQMQQQPNQEQMMQMVQQAAQMLEQGAQPEQVMQQLVQAGIPQDMAMQAVQMAMQEMQGQMQQQGQEQPMQGEEQMMPPQGMAKGGRMYANGGGPGDEVPMPLVNPLVGNQPIYTPDTGIEQFAPDASWLDGGNQVAAPGNVVSWPSFPDEGEDLEGVSLGMPTREREIRGRRNSFDLKDIGRGFRRLADGKSFSRRRPANPGSVECFKFGEGGEMYYDMGGIIPTVNPTAPMLPTQPLPVDTTMGNASALPVTAPVRTPSRVWENTGKGSPGRWRNLDSTDPIERKKALDANRANQNIRNNQMPISPTINAEGGMIPSQSGMASKVADDLRKGAQPQDVLNQLVGQGMSQQQATAMVQAIMGQLKNEMQQQQPQQQMMAARGGYFNGKKQYGDGDEWAPNQDKDEESTGNTFSPLADESTMSKIAGLGQAVTPALASAFAFNKLSKRKIKPTAIEAALQNRDAEISALRDEWRGQTESGLRQLRNMGQTAGSVAGNTRELILSSLKEGQKPIMQIYSELSAANQQAEQQARLANKQATDDFTKENESMYQNAMQTGFEAAGNATKNLASYYADKQDRDLQRWQAQNTVSENKYWTPKGLAHRDPTTGKFYINKVEVDLKSGDPIE